jgi:hypothetical protein
VEIGEDPLRGRGLFESARMGGGSLPNSRTAHAVVETETTGFWILSRILIVIELKLIYPPCLLIILNVAL